MAQNNVDELRSPQWFPQNPKQEVQELQPERDSHRWFAFDHTNVSVIKTVHGFRLRDTLSPLGGKIMRST